MSRHPGTWVQRMRAAVRQEYENPGPEHGDLGETAAPERDATLSAWAERTRDCRRCDRSGPQRVLCDGCRASMPPLELGLRHQEKAALKFDRRHHRRHDKR